MVGPFRDSVRKVLQKTVERDAVAPTGATRAPGDIFGMDEVRRAHAAILGSEARQPLMNDDIPFALRPASGNAGNKRPLVCRGLRV